MKVQHWMLALVIALPLAAQTQVQEEKHVQVFMKSPGGMPGGPASVQIMSNEIALVGPPVTGKPYQADSTTDMVQTLGDGTHITRHSTSKVYRDKDGRTRREEAVTEVGPNAPPKGTVMIYIHDPVAKVDYILDSSDKTARKIQLPDMPVFKVRSDGKGDVFTAPPGGERVAHRVMALPPAGGPGGPGGRLPIMGNVMYFARESADLKTEDLGTKQIEGVTVKGQRTTATIPVDAIGNDRAIVSTTETWTSEDLGQVVSSKTTDPRFGDSTYTLTNIQRVDQPSNLFEVPSDYTVKDSGNMRMDFKVRTDGPKKEE